MIKKKCKIQEIPADHSFGKISPIQPSTSSQINYSLKSYDETMKMYVVQPKSKKSFKLKKLSNKSKKSNPRNPLAQYQIEDSNLRYLNADLPTTTWIMHSGNISIINNRSYLARPTRLNCRLMYSNNRLEAVGNVNLLLQDNSMIRIQNVYYSPNSRYNLISINALSKTMNFILDLEDGIGYSKVQIDGKSKLIEIMQEVGQKFVLLTRYPKIEEVIKYAIQHETPDAAEIVCPFTMRYSQVTHNFSSKYRSQLNNQHNRKFIIKINRINLILSITLKKVLKNRLLTQVPDFIISFINKFAINLTINLTIKSNLQKKLKRDQMVN